MFLFLLLKYVGIFFWINVLLILLLYLVAKIGQQTKTSNADANVKSKENSETNFRYLLVFEYQNLRIARNYSWHLKRRRKKNFYYFINFFEVKNKKCRLNYALSILSESSNCFKDTFGYIRMDKMLFHLTKVKYKFYLSHDEEILNRFWKVKYF